MNLTEELKAMEENYRNSPLKDIFLPHPTWLGHRDPMAAIYRDKMLLLQHGRLAYAHIVQANEVLFRSFPPADCPAHIVYSTSPAVMEDPAILRELAHQLFYYKDKPFSQVPEQWRDVAQVITNEYDRSGFTLPLTFDGQPVEVRMIPVMIFRKLLPKRRLCGSFLPILTDPDSSTVMVLPKRYWTPAFTGAWCAGQI